MIDIQNLNLSFNEKESSHIVLHDVNLTIDDGEFFVLLGPSGCGKTTLLRCIGGFITPDSGTILLDNQKVSAPTKDCMMIFQSFDQLFPWYTVQENILYGLKKVNGSLSKQEQITLADYYLNQVGLSGFEHHYPHTLSGGMKQRGALARALALKPKVLLMDEPFSSLDYHIRKEAGQLIKHLAKENNCTIVFVTHDIEEAISLGTRIVVFNKNDYRVSDFTDFDQFKELLTQDLS